MFVVARDVDALHMLRRAEPHKDAVAAVEAEHRLVVQHVGHRTIRRRLARHRAGVGMAEVAVDTQRAEDVVGRHLAVYHVMDLLAAHRPVEALTVMRFKPRHYRERRFLVGLRFTGAAVGAQLVNFMAEGDEFAVEFVKGAEAKIAFGQEIRDGGIAFINPTEQSAHHGCLIYHTFCIFIP